MRGEIIKPGEICSQTIDLPSGERERIDYLRDLVGGHIETVPMPGAKYMCVFEDAKLYKQTINVEATAMAIEAESISELDYIAGTVVIVPSEALA